MLCLFFELVPWSQKYMSPFFLTRSIFTRLRFLATLTNPNLHWGSSKVREAMTGGGEMKRGWGWACGFFRLLLREEGRNSVVLVGLTAEHAHTLSSIWFLPNEHQTPLVKSLAHGGKRCLCKSPRAVSSAAKQQNASASCRATGNWNHLSFCNLNPPLPLFSSLPHASLFLSLHRRLLAKTQATVTEVKRRLVSFLPHSFLASPAPVISAITVSGQNEREVQTHQLVTTEMYRSNLYEHHHSNSQWAMLTTLKLPLVWSVQAETVIQKEHWFWFKKRLLLNHKMPTQIM